MQDVALQKTSLKAMPLPRTVLIVLAGTIFLAISSWVSIPTVPVPITMQTFAIIVLGALLGMRLATITVLAWLLEAALGLPVLVRGAALLPTLGYIISFPMVAAFTGWLSDRHYDRTVLKLSLSMLGGNALNLIVGTLWLMGMCGWQRGFAFGFAPFWIGGLVKAAMAVLAVIVARKTWLDKRTPTAAGR